MKNRIVVDIHTHTIASGHAYGTPRENAQAARDIGLIGLGMSEHAPGIDGTCHPIYLNNIRTIPNNLYGVKIYYGVENNVLNDGSMPLPERILNKLDYGIVGIHGLCYWDEGIEKNTENLISCMKHPKIFFVSHPDDSTWPVDYEKVVKAAKEYGVALEVNESTLRNNFRKNCQENIRYYLSLCMKYQVPIYLGSDAHDPSFIGKFPLSIQLIDEIGFDEELIINTSIEKFEDFIHYHQ